MNFIPLQGDDLGVLRNENYRVVQTIDGDITFSYTKQGDGMVCHFAASKDALRGLKQAINGFCAWMFENYHPKCIFAVVKRKSVGRLIEKCGFKHIADDERKQMIYIKNNQVEV